MPSWPNENKQTKLLHLHSAWEGVREGQKYTSMIWPFLQFSKNVQPPLQRSKNGWGDKTSLLIYSVQQLRSCFGSFWLWSSSSSSSSRSWRKERSSAVAGTAYPWAPPTEQHLPTCRHILKCCRCDATNWALLPFGKSARKKTISALWLTGGPSIANKYISE